MYLKSLTMRGFKSFASATTLRLEPGITCVVGPNGSGKSNVVDALSWVMGEQGIKSLRGGKMEDVVFAGTTSRAPLGRAEVTLTIDNSDGALPIEYTEVTLSRLMFRSGQSEYAINGDQCRLLDVQELLSDSGLGREMHVIVGQNQLEMVLHAGPEARRAMIEEAAGVLKHRRRKEKALRKLEAMQANLTRLVDLTAELGRRLKPLGRQAEMARKAAVIQAELRDAKLRLLADDYVTLAADLQRDEADEAAVAARRAVLERNLAQARTSEAELDQAAQHAAEELARAQETWFALSSLAERLRGTQNLAAQRHSLLTEQADPERPGRDPDELDRQAAELREEEEGLTARLAAGREVLTAAVAERTAAEAELSAAERRIAEGAKAAAARAGQLARLREQVGAAASRGAAAQEELDRLAASAAEATQRAERAQAEHDHARELADDRGEDRTGLAAAHKQAAEILSNLAERTVVLRAAERESARELAALRARAEALAEAARRGVDASEALLADPGRFAGVLGSFAERLQVAEGFEVAIATALGAAADAVAVSSLDAAAEILSALRRDDAGSAALVIAASNPEDPANALNPEDPASSSSPEDLASLAALVDPVSLDDLTALISAVTATSSSTVAPAAPSGRQEGPVRAVDLVRAPGGLAEAAAALLGDVVITADLEEARRIVRDHPEVRAVTRAGDLLGSRWAQGGGARPQSLFELRAAAEEAAAGLAGAQRRCEEAAGQLAAAAQAEEQARQSVAEALAQLQQADAAAAETSGRLGRLAGTARAERDEAGRLDRAIEAARLASEQGQAKLARLRQDLEAAEAAADAYTDEPLESPDGDGAPREDLAKRCTAAREAEMEARLEVRTAEERLRAISGRAGSLAAAATAERKARE
ncbi:MAG: chromosome segregation SMC family protein, partial [Streptosporangiaceae bacterium]